MYDTSIFEVNKLWEAHNRKWETSVFCSGNERLLKTKHPLSLHFNHTTFFQLKPLTWRRPPCCSTVGRWSAIGRWSCCEEIWRCLWPGKGSPHQCCCTKLCGPKTPTISKSVRSYIHIWTLCVLVSAHFFPLHKSYLFLTILIFFFFPEYSDFTLRILRNKIHIILAICGVYWCTNKEQMSIPSCHSFTSSAFSPVLFVVSASSISMPTSASSSLSIPSTLVLSSRATCWALRGSWDFSRRSNTPSSQAEKITWRDKHTVTSTRLLWGDF